MPSSTEFTTLCDNINKMFEGLGEENKYKMKKCASYAIYLPEQVGVAIQGDWRKDETLFPVAKYKYGLASLAFTEQYVRETSFTEEFVQAFQDKLTQAYTELPKKITGNILNEEGRYGSILNNVDPKVSHALRTFVKIETGRMMRACDSAPNQTSKNVVMRDMINFYEITRNAASIMTWMQDKITELLEEDKATAASEKSVNPFGEAVNEEENLLIENITAVMGSVRDKKIGAISNDNGLSVEEKKEKMQKLTKNMDVYKENISQEIKSRVDMGSKKAIAAVIRESANPTPENKAEVQKIKEEGEQPQPTGDEPTPKSFTP